MEELLLWCMQRSLQLHICFLKPRVICLSPKSLILGLKWPSGYYVVCSIVGMHNSKALGDLKRQKCLRDSIAVNC